MGLFNKRMPKKNIVESGAVNSDDPELCASHDHHWPQVVREVICQRRGNRQGLVNGYTRINTHLETRASGLRNKLPLLCSLSV